MAWVLRLVENGVDGQARGLDVMEISRPDNLRDVVLSGLVPTGLFGRPRHRW